MKTSTILSACGALILAIPLALLATGCHDDSAGVTSATSVSSSDEMARFETTGASASRSGPTDSRSEDDKSDDTSDDDSSDDVSEDAPSEDDVSEDEDVDEAEVKGLFFGVEACPGIEGCIVSLRIKDTLVVVTSDTEIVNRAAGDELVDPADLEALIDGHLGLPMRAEGTFEGGVLVARKLRLQDEIRATGEVVPGAVGCAFGLDVRGDVLCFELSAGVTAPALASTVRVEGFVPSDFSLPFVATRIKASDD